MAKERKTNKGKKREDIIFSEEERSNALDYIFEQIGQGRSVRQILRDDKDIIKLPSREAFYTWLTRSVELLDRYAYVTKVRADILFDEIFEIADDGRNDTYVNSDGLEVTNHEHVQRSRLRIDARKWALARMAPEKYGDKQEHDVKHTGSVNVINLGNGKKQ